MSTPAEAHDETNLGGEGRGGCCGLIFKLVGAGVLLLVGAVVAAFAFQPWDDPPPDTSDLEVPGETIPDAANAWIPLQQAAAELTRLRTVPATRILLADEGDDPVELLEEVEELADDDGADGELLDALRALLHDLPEAADGEEDWPVRAAHDAAWSSAAGELRTFLVLLEDAVARGTLQLPAPTYEYDETFDYLAGWRHMVELVCAAALAEARASEPERALEFAFLASDVASLYEHGSVSLVHGLVALASRGIALDALQGIAATGDVSAPMLVGAVRRLVEHPVCVGCLQDALRHEFRAQERAHEHLAAGEGEWLDFVGADSGRTGRILLATGYGYLHNRSVAETAADFRRLIENVGRHESSLVPAAPFVDPRKERLLVRLARGNMLGERMIAELSVIGVSPRFRRASARHGATELILALRAHELEHGELPESLDELVPGTLAALPSDPADGGPFGYSREERLLRSRILPDPIERALDGGVVFRLGF